jgi:hypothetical protein
MATNTDHRSHEIRTADARRRQIRLTQAILAGAATVAMLVLFDSAQAHDANTVVAGGSVRLADHATELRNLVGAGGFATDDNDDEAQLQQQLLNQQETDEAEQQAEEQEQLDNQQAQQDEQQGLLTEQQANLDVPGTQ